MRRHGDGHKRALHHRVRLGLPDTGRGRRRFEKGPAVQADYLKRAWEILLANRRRWHLRAAYWFTWQDIPAATHPV